MSAVIDLIRGAVVKRRVASLVVVSGGRMLASWARHPFQKDLILFLYLIAAISNIGKEKPGLSPTGYMP
jgi:hypothetical protein